MSSRRTAKFSKQNSFAPGLETEGTEEPIWEFDDSNDVVTVAMQEIATTIIKDTSFNLQSYSAVVSSSSDALTKSNVCLLIISAFLHRLNMIQAAKNALSQSDSVAALFNSLNLGEKANLNFFCTMVNIISPEIGKQIEAAAFTAMSRMSGKTNVVHTQSRIKAAMTGLNDTKIASGDELAWAAGNSRAFSKEKPWEKYSRMAQDEDSYMINEMLDRYQISPDPKPDEKSILRFLRETRANNRDVHEFDKAFPNVTAPVQGFASQRRQGLGFAPRQPSVEPDDSISQVAPDDVSSKTKVIRKGNRPALQRKKTQAQVEDSAQDMSVVLDSMSALNNEPEDLTDLEDTITGI